MDDIIYPTEALGKEKRGGMKGKQYSKEEWQKYCPELMKY